MGRFPLAAASALTPRGWLRLGLCLQAYADSDVSFEYAGEDEIQCYRNALRRARPREKQLQADCHYYIALVADDQLRDASLAEAEYRAALRLNANLPSAQNNLGLVLQRKEPPDLKNAEKAFRDAIALDPAHMNARCERDAETTRDRAC